jgi:hypothetical protein
LRTSQPQLEQSLFARGLGGSRYYQDALTDLLSKVATQGVLNREQLSQSDESMKLNQLASILGAGQTNYGNMSNLMGASADQTNQTYQNWMNMLPYTARVNAPSASPWGTIGSLLGTGAGAYLGGTQGAGIGSALGGSIGGMAGGSPSQLDLSWLAGLNMPKAANTYGDLYSSRIPSNTWKLTDILGGGYGNG